MSKFSSNEYFKTYGCDIEIRERRYINSQRAVWKKNLNGILSIMLEGYNLVIDNAQLLMPDWGQAKKQITERAFIYWVSSGFIKGHNFDEVWTTNGAGETVSNVYFQPNHTLMKMFLKEHPICSYAEFESAVKQETPLYAAEGALSETQCGEFFLQIIPQMPAYHEDALYKFRNAYVPRSSPSVPCALPHICGTDS